MKQLGLSVEPEFYFDICPWQTLAVINLEFIYSERRRNYLKFAGGLCFFEVSLHLACKSGPTSLTLALLSVIGKMRFLSCASVFDANHQLARLSHAPATSVASEIKDSALAAPSDKYLVSAMANI